MATIEKQPLPAPDAQPITENDRPRLYDAIGRALNDVLSGPQSYYPDGVQKDPQDIMSDLDSFMASLKNFRENYVIDPSDVMGPMVDRLQQRVNKFKKFFEDQPNDPIRFPNEKLPTIKDNEVIYVNPFPGPETPPNPIRRRPPYYDASAELPDGAGDQPDSPPFVAYPRLSTRTPSSNLASNNLPGLTATTARITPLLGIYSGRPMRQWIVPPPIWRAR